MTAFKGRIQFKDGRELKFFTYTQITVIQFDIYEVFCRFLLNLIN